MEGLSPDEAEKLSEHFTPMWEQEEANAESSTMRGLAPPGGAQPVAPQPIKPVEKPADQPVGKQTVLGLAPPAQPEAAAAGPSAAEISPQKTVLGLAPPIEPKAAAAPHAESSAAAPNLAAKPELEAPKAAVVAASPAAAVPVPPISMGEMDTYEVPKKSRKLAFGILGGAVLLLLIVGIKVIAGGSSKAATATRADSVPVTQATTPKATAQTAAPAPQTAAPSPPPEPTETATDQAEHKTPPPPSPVKAKKPKLHARTSRPSSAHKGKKTSSAAFPSAPAKPVPHATRPKGGSGSIVRQTPF